MDANVQLYLEENSSIPIRLVLTSPPDSLLTFQDSESPDGCLRSPVRSLSWMHLSSSNPPLITLHGSDIDVSFTFDSHDRIGVFLDLLTKQMSCDPDKSDPSHIVLTPLPPTGLLGLVASVLPAPPPGIATTPEAITNGLIHPLLPRRQLPLLSAQDAAASDASSLDFSSIAVSQDVWTILYDKLLNSPLNLPEYQILTKQWKSTELDQWTNFSRMRTFVANLDLWLSESQYKEHQRVFFFNVLMAVFMDRTDTAVFSEGLAFVAGLFFKLFVSKSEPTQPFKWKTGETLGAIESEAKMFGYLRVFYDRISGQFRIDRELRAVKELLGKISPSTKAILEKRKLASIEFAQAEIDGFLAKGRNLADAMLILTTVMSCRDFGEWRVRMMGIAFVLLHDRLREIPSADAETFQNTFVAELRKINARLLVYNYNELAREVRG
jgi:hypothetical protein